MSLMTAPSSGEKRQVIQKFKLPSAKFTANTDVLDVDGCKML